MDSFVVVVVVAAAVYSMKSGIYIVTVSQDTQKSCYFMGPLNSRSTCVYSFFYIDREVN